MIRELELSNFRCFENHVVELSPLSIIVGKNNAGKSTITDALRLVSVVASRFRVLNYSDPPDWLDIPRRNRGVVPSSELLNINFATIFNRYSDPPSRTTARFEQGQTVTVYVGPQGALFGVILDKHGQPVDSRGAARDFDLPHFHVQPQIGPVLPEEELLDHDYVRRNMFSSRASLHFRNEILYFREHFETFSSLSEKTWHGISLEPVRIEEDKSEFVKRLFLYVRDRDFVGEVATMGHGLQMWLQTMWFLARAELNACIALDEPDVYMHADLQRKLIRLLRNRHRQVLIATHSVEIMAEVDPQQVIVVDRRKPRSKAATSLPAVQRVVESLGGIHNIQLARLWSAKKFLIVEGDDLSLLRILQNKLFPSSEEPLDTVPGKDIGGWGGWNYAVGSSMVLNDAAGKSIRVYCLFDSDYHTPTQLSARFEDAEKKNVHLHIWAKKEIENYLLVPAAIQRALCAGASRGKRAPEIAEIERELLTIAESLKRDCLNATAQEFFSTREAKNVKEANELADKKIEPAWTDLESRLSVICGKEVISALSKWAQAKYGTGLSAAKLAHNILPSELSPELIQVMTAIEKGIDLRRV